MNKPRPRKTARRRSADVEVVEQRICYLRGQKVLLDKDLAELYGVETKVFNQAVKRNLKRFPPDFMFHLSMAETRAIQRSRSQIVTLNRGQNFKYAPRAFTREGVAMLSSVLHSRRAIHMNIAIMRAFIRFGDSLSGRPDILRWLEQLVHHHKEHGKILVTILEVVHELRSADTVQAHPIGFITGLTPGQQ